MEMHIWNPPRQTTEAQPIPNIRWDTLARLQLSTGNTVVTRENNSHGITQQSQDTKLMEQQVGTKITLDDIDEFIKCNSDESFTEINPDGPSVKQTGTVEIASGNNIELNYNPLSVEQQAAPGSLNQSPISQTQNNITIGVPVVYQKDAPDISHLSSGSALPLTNNQTGLTNLPSGEMQGSEEQVKLAKQVHKHLKESGQFTQIGNTVIYMVTNDSSMSSATSTVHGTQGIVVQSALPNPTNISTSHTGSVSAQSNMNGSLPPIGNIFKSPSKTPLQMKSILSTNVSLNESPSNVGDNLPCGRQVVGEKNSFGIVTKLVGGSFYQVGTPGNSVGTIPSHPVRPDSLIQHNTVRPPRPSLISAQRSPISSPLPPSTEKASSSLVGTARTNTISLPFKQHEKSVLNTTKMKVAKSASTVDQNLNVSSVVDQSGNIVQYAFGNSNYLLSQNIPRQASSFVNPQQVASKLNANLVNSKNVTVLATAQQPQQVVMPPHHYLVVKKSKKAKKPKPSIRYEIVRSSELKDASAPQIKNDVQENMEKAIPGFEQNSVASMVVSEDLHSTFANLSPISPQQKVPVSRTSAAASLAVQNATNCVRPASVTHSAAPHQQIIVNNSAGSSGIHQQQPDAVYSCKEKMIADISLQGTNSLSHALIQPLVQTNRVPEKTNVQVSSNRSQMLFTPQQIENSTQQNIRTQFVHNPQKSEVSVSYSDSTRTPCEVSEPIYTLSVPQNTSDVRNNKSMQLCIMPLASTEFSQLKERNPVAMQTNRNPGIPVLLKKQAPAHKTKDGRVKKNEKLRSTKFVQPRNSTFAHHLNQLACKLKEKEAKNVGDLDSRQAATGTTVIHMDTLKEREFGQCSPGPDTDSDCTITDVEVAKPNVSSKVNTNNSTHCQKNAFQYSFGAQTSQSSFSPFNTGSSWKIVGGSVKKSDEQVPSKPFPAPSNKQICLQLVDAHEQRHTPVLMKTNQIPAKPQSGVFVQKGCVSLLNNNVMQMCSRPNNSDKAKLEKIISEHKHLFSQLVPKQFPNNKWDPFQGKSVTYSYTLGGLMFAPLLLFGNHGNSQLDEWEVESEALIDKYYTYEDKVQYFLEHKSKALEAPADPVVISVQTLCANPDMKLQIDSEDLQQILSQRIQVKIENEVETQIGISDEINEICERDLSKKPQDEDKYRRKPDDVDGVDKTDQFLSESHSGEIVHTAMETSTSGITTLDKTDDNSFPSNNKIHHVQNTQNRVNEMEDNKSESDMVQGNNSPMNGSGIQNNVSTKIYEAVQDNFDEAVQDNLSENQTRDKNQENHMPSNYTKESGFPKHVDSNIVIPSLTTAEKVLTSEKWPGSLDMTAETVKDVFDPHPDDIKEEDLNLKDEVKEEKYDTTDSGTCILVKDEIKVENNPRLDTTISSNSEDVFDDTGSDFGALNRSGIRALIEAGGLDEDMVDIETIEEVPRIDVLDCVEVTVNEAKNTETMEGFGCYLCTYCTLSKDKLVNHWMKEHVPQSPYLCGICRKAAFSSSITLIDHIKLYHKSFTECIPISLKKSEMYKNPIVMVVGKDENLSNQKLCDMWHIDECALPEEAEPDRDGTGSFRLALKNVAINCNMCSFFCKYVMEMRSHLRDHHEKYYNFPCVTCKRSFNCRFDLLWHTREKHPEDKKTLTILTGKVESDPLENCQLQKLTVKIAGGNVPWQDGCYIKKLNRNEHKSVYKCKMCIMPIRFESSTAKDMWNHLTEKHSWPPSVTCDTCNYRTLILDSERKANRTCCPQCYKTFSLDPIIVEENLGEQQVYICKICDYKTMDKSAMYRHTKYSYANYKPYLCPYCEYSSPEKMKVRKHVIGVHRGEEPMVKVFPDLITDMKERTRLLMKKVAAVVKYRELDLYCGDDIDLHSEYNYCKTADPIPRLHEAAHTETTKEKDILDMMLPDPQQKQKPHQFSKFQCHDCDFLAMSWVTYSRHRRQAHRDNSAPAPAPLSSRHANSVEKLGNVPFHFCCSVCDYLCADRSSMTRHIKYMHMHERPHGCPYCGYKNVEKTKVRIHVQAAHKDFEASVITDNNLLRLMSQKVKGYYKKVRGNGQEISQNVAKGKISKPVVKGKTSKPPPKKRKTEKSMPFLNISNAVPRHFVINSHTEHTVEMDALELAANADEESKEVKVEEEDPDFDMIQIKPEGIASGSECFTEYFDPTKVKEEPLSEDEYNMETSQRNYSSYSKSPGSKYSPIKVSSSTSVKHAKKSPRKGSRTEIHDVDDYIEDDRVDDVDWVFETIEEMDSDDSDDDCDDDLDLEEHDLVHSNEPILGRKRKRNSTVQNSAIQSERMEELMKSDPKLQMKPVVGLRDVIQDVFTNENHPEEPTSTSLIYTPNFEN